MTPTSIKISPFYRQPQDDSILYRYVTIDKLLDFLFGGRIPLVRLNVFDDRLEGVNINHLLLNFASDKIAEQTADWVGGTLKLLGQNFVVNPGKRNSLRSQRDAFQDSNYASCWYVSDHESVAMWQLYSNPDSVAIRIPFKALSDELINNNFDLPKYNYNQLKYGSIDYHKFNDIDELTKIVVRENVEGFIKDSSFKHEQEFRIMLQIKEAEKKTLNSNSTMLHEHVEEINKGRDISIIYLSLLNFTTLPFEIIFHPQSFRWHRENINRILTKFELPFKTSQSALKDIFR